MVNAEYLTKTWGFANNEYDEYYIDRKDAGPTVMYLHFDEWLLTGDSPDGRICVEEKVITNQEQFCDLMKVLEVTPK